MALETYLDSSCQLAAPPKAPAKLAGGFAQSSSSGILFQKGGQPSSGNIFSSITKMAQLNVGMVSGDMNLSVLNNATVSGLSAGASSLVTDANSVPSMVTHLQQNTNTTMESSINFSSPVALLSNNLSSSGSSDIDSTAQDCRQVRKRQQQQQQGGFTAASQLVSQTHHFSHPTGVKQASGTSTPKHKKSRLDLKQDDILHQQIIQQLLQRPDSVQLQGHNSQLQALIQQHSLRNQQQQQMLRSIPRSEGLYKQQRQQQQQHQWMRHHLHQHAMHHVSSMKQPYDGGVCARRLMQYIYNLRHRPPDNSILYWRKFVAEYYAPCAKKKWCLSLYDNVGHHALGVFPQVAMDAWHCDICGSKSGKGLEAVFEVLPRLSKINFESGVVDELLFLDMPHEHRLPSGLMMLEYRKAVQESVYKQLRVVREGQLRIIFTQELKIFSWEFCARRHEELLSRGLVAPEVNQLVQAARKYQSVTNESGSGGVSPQDLQANCNMFLTAGRQLARNLELQLVDDLGFSKRYVRCLQISQVVNSMKDLMTFSWENNVGPIESLKNYAGEASIAKIKTKQMKEREQPVSTEDQSTDGSKLVAVHPGVTCNMEDASPVARTGLSTGSEQAALTLTTCCQKLLRQNSLNSNLSVLKQEPSCLLDSSNKGGSASPVNNSKSSSMGAVNGLSSSHSSLASQNMQQCMIQKLLWEMMNSSRGNCVQSERRVEEEVLCGSNRGNGGLATGARGADMVGCGLGFGGSTAAVAVPGTILGDVVGRIDSFKAASNSNSSGIYGNGNFVKREPYSLEKLCLPDVISDMAPETCEDGVFNGNQEDIGYA